MNLDHLKEVTLKAEESLGGGVLSVGYKNLSTGEVFFHNETRIFPAASIVKVPIMLEYFRQIEMGQLDPNEEVELLNRDKVGGAGILREMHEGLKPTLCDLVRLMIVISDNTASNIMLDRLGMDEINAFMRTLGLQDTVIGRKFMIDPNSKFAKNFTSTRDMVKLYEMLYCGKILNPENTRECIEIMSRQQYREKIPLLLPPGLKIAHKTGEISGIRHDCAIVIDSKVTYILCILTEQVPDERAADMIIAQLSLEFYNDSI